MLKIAPSPLGELNKCSYCDDDDYPAGLRTQLISGPLDPECKGISSELEGFPPRCSSPVQDPEGLSGCSRFGDVRQMDKETRDSLFS